MGERRCIYCLEDKPEAAFNREHVIPQAFGRFENNLVLDCVCKECNDFFAETLDLKLGRDSFEGFQRFRKGLISPARFKSLGKRSTSRVEVQEDGSMKGLLCVTTVGPDGNFRNEPLPQIGFAKSEAGPFQYSLLDDVPSRAELTQQGYPDGTRLTVQFWGVPKEEALKLLHSKGFKGGDFTGEIQLPNRPVYFESVFKISHPEFRVVSKIAINYVGAVFGSAIARMPEFNPIRQYIRRDELLGEVPVKPIDSLKIEHNGRVVRGHYVAVQKVGQRVVAQVSLLSTIRWLVTLSEGPFVIPWKAAACHVFDLDTKTAVPAPVPPVPRWSS
jgi:hypothetical protein